MKLVVGLGNPGRTYEHTRHNAGFEAMDAIASLTSASITQKKFKALVDKVQIGKESVLLMKPQTYMNNSGEAVRAAMDFYRLSPQDLLVIYDDLDLPIGKLRLRQKGSAGGHNGIKSIQAHIKSQEFDRIRIGIDKDARIPTVDWVLGKIRKEDAQAYQESIEQAAKAAVFALQHSFADAMNQFNKR